MKKQTLLSWNVLEQAGISGGARIYDVYIRVPDSGSTAIKIVDSSTRNLKGQPTKHVTTKGRLVISKNNRHYTLTGQEL
jgi:hypothetical protein